MSAEPPSITAQPTLSIVPREDFSADDQDRTLHLSEVVGTLQLLLAARRQARTARLAAD